MERDGFTAEAKIKLDKLAQRWIRRGLIGPIYGTRQIELRKLPPACQNEWMTLHMAPWKRKLADANKQIKTMKSVLNFPDACGVLFIVGDSAHSLPPQDVMNFIARVLRSKKPDGDQIYSHLDRIVYLSVNPRAVTLDGKALNFWLSSYRNTNEKPVSEFLDNLGRAWFAYHTSLFGMKPVEMSFKDQPFKGTWTEGLRGLRVRD